MKTKTQETTFNPAAMNQAAAQAEKAFKSCRTAKDVCAWFAEWYLKTGHKRLGRFLIAQAQKE